MVRKRTNKSRMSWLLEASLLTSVALDVILVLGLDQKMEPVLSMELSIVLASALEVAMMFAVFMEDARW